MNIIKYSVFLIATLLINFLFCLAAQIEYLRCLPFLNYGLALSLSIHLTMHRVNLKEFCWINFMSIASYILALYCGLFLLCILPSDFDSINEVSLIVSYVFASFVGSLLICISILTWYAEVSYSMMMLLVPAGGIVGGAISIASMLIFEEHNFMNKSIDSFIPLVSWQLCVNMGIALCMQEKKPNVRHT